MGKTPLSIAIFGITGDLARNKLIPALFDLFRRGELGNNFSIVGYGRKNLSAEEFSSLVSESLIGTGQNKSSTDDLRKRGLFIHACKYVQGELNDAEGYNNLRKTILKSSRTIYFFAVHPELHEVIIAQLGKGKLLNSKSQVMIEKPFGHNVKTALNLDKKLCRYIKENQIYRIDHYLGKAELIKLIERRRTDKAFESAVLNDLSEVSVNLWEAKTISKRGAFYDGVGALKDVGQNHLIQMLAAVIAPSEITSKISSKVQAARAEALHSFRLSTPALRAQYISYHNEPGVNPHSQTETFFSVSGTSSLHKKTVINISAGKALSESSANIKISFKKSSGLSDVVYELNHKIDDKKRPMDAYERVFLAALNKDQSFFCSLDEVIAGWKFDAAVRSFWKKHHSPLKKYKVGDSIHIPKKKRA